MTEQVNHTIKEIEMNVNRKRIERSSLDRMSTVGRDIGDRRSKIERTRAPFFRSDKNGHIIGKEKRNRKTESETKSSDIFFTKLTAKDQTKPKTENHTRTKLNNTPGRR
jgi:hypothetical protein